MIMWLSRPLYESLPYNYIVVGLVALAGSFFLSYWYWPIISAGVGLASLIAGLVVWLKRRGYRQSRSRQAVSDSAQRQKNS
jgi:protein-S-isoprenylcysteine O-methyltransferase Ste14